jgi:predicted amidophosphoribosyltransferase
MKGELPNSLMPSSRNYPGITELHHAAYYHAPRMGYQDVVSRTILEFKHGCEPQTTRWINLVVGPAMRTLKFDLIVRALGHEETISSGATPLDRLCSALAKESSKPYDHYRLTKERVVQPLASLGGRTARETELSGVYHFDPEGIPENGRVLLVDDFAATGVTLKAISTAIKSSREDLQTVCLVLARADAEHRNAHLDPEYFIRPLAGAACVEVSHRKAHEKPGNDDPHPRMTSVKHSNAGSEITKAARATPARGARTVGGPKPPLQVNLRRGIPVWVYASGLSCSLLLLGATVLLPKSKNPADPPAQFIQLVEAQAVTSLDPIPERQVSQAPTDGKPAVITVPSTGLRVGHSMDARPIPKVTLKNREKVYILRRIQSAFGPDWIQLRSQSGVTGWVVASVVREIRG